MWMAPNLITLTGFGFVIINVLTLLWYNPTLDQDCPPWVYFSWAIGLFLYQTFDAVDGTQAYCFWDCVVKEHANTIAGDEHIRVDPWESYLTMELMR